MESYEEFCSRVLARLQSESKRETMCCHSFDPRHNSSAIRFHGRTILPPLLTEERRREMCVHRQRAIEKEAERAVRSRRSLPTQIPTNVDHHAQVYTPIQKPRDLQLSGSPGSVDSGSPETELLDSLSLGLDPPCLPKERTAAVDTLSLDLPGPFGSLPQGMTTSPSHPRGEELMVGRSQGQEVQEEEEEEEEMSLQSLLRKSRQYMERERGRSGFSESEVPVDTAISLSTPRTSQIARVTESLSDKENENRGTVAVTATLPCQSPVASALAVTTIPSPGEHQSQGHPTCKGLGQSNTKSSPPVVKRVPSGPNAWFCQPQPSLSPRPHRGRPRPVSAYDVLYPQTPNSATSTSPMQEGAVGFRPRELGASWLTMDQQSPADQGSTAPSIGTSLNRRTSPSSTSPLGESRMSANVVKGYGAVAGFDHSGETARFAGPEGFRRRCHTLDSQTLDRSKERLPRFMAGVAQRPIPVARCLRSPPSTGGCPTSSSPYPQESPVPALLRAHGLGQAHSPVTPDASACGQLRRRLDSSSDQEGRRTPSALTTPVDDRQIDSVDAVQKRAQALVEQQAFQLPFLLTEQEKEQQHLQQVLGEDVEELGLSGIPCSPNHNLWPPERSLLHSNNSFPSPQSPCRATSPSAPIYAWGSLRGSSSKPRGRLSQVLTDDQQRALCRLTAVVRGFLVRRLLKTEKVKHLRQTVQDTQEFISSFQTEAPQRRGSLSPQDLSLQERVRAQLRAARFDLHDIFFELSLEERLALLQQDRELRMERKLREMEKTKTPKDRKCLSAATQKSLDRKKRVGESPGPVRKSQQKPKSPSTTRILLPNQGQNAPKPNQVHHQGSWYRKTPEERLKRSSSLKKRNSLG